MTHLHAHTFDNGLRLALEQRPTLGVSLEFHVPFGSALDPAGLEGLGAVVAEWMFRGAGPHDAQALLNLLDDLSTGRDSGGVSSEHMPFKTSCLPEHFEQVLEVLGQVCFEPHFKSAELKSLTSLALADVETVEDSPADQAQVLFKEALLGHGYGHYPSGNRQSLKKITHARAVQHHQHISMQGAVLTVVGNISWERVCQAAERVFCAWNRPAPVFPEPVLPGPFVKHVQHQSQQTHLLLAHPAVGPTSPHWYPFMLAVNALSGGSSSRLFEEVREKRGLVYTVHAGMQVIRSQAYLQTYASSTPGKAQETLEVILQVLSSWKKGISEAELQDARVGVLSDLIMSGENSRARAAQMARDLWRLGRVRSLQEVQTQVLAVTLPEVQHMLDSWEPELLGLLTLGQEELHVS